MSQTMDKPHYRSLKAELNAQEKFLFDKILYHHDKISRKNKNLNLFSNLLKISVFILAGSTTVVLGLETEGFEKTAKNLAIVFGALITLLSAILSYLNIERFWMRSITNHLRINKIRDEFVFYYHSDEGLSKERINRIFEELISITNLNIEYWENAIGERDKA